MQVMLLAKVLHQQPKYCAGLPACYLKAVPVRPHGFFHGNTLRYQL